MLPAWFSASNAMPALIAPSPITATTRRVCAAARGGDRHAERRADRRARMTDAERVVFALAARRERRQAVLELDRAQPVAPSGQHLVRIRLVADVPHQPVVRRVEDIMQRDGELDGAEAGGEVAAHLADGVDQVLAQLVGDARQLGRRQRAQVGRRVDALQAAGRTACVMRRELQ